jgi:hypothetical protein
MALVMMTYQLRAALDALDAHNSLRMELGERWAVVSRTDGGIEVASGDRRPNETEHNVYASEQFAIMLAHNYLSTGIRVAVLAEEHADIFVAMA